MTDGLILSILGLFIVSVSQAREIYRLEKRITKLEDEPRTVVNNA
jgi:hypothetical protein